VTRSSGVIIVLLVNGSLVGTSCTWVTAPGAIGTRAPTRGRGPTASALYVAVGIGAPIDGPHAVDT
jgi:hypothetical protein